MIAEVRRKKRNQINVTLEDSECSDINEYCRVYRMTPQSLLKAGARKLIEEDILERKADLHRKEKLGVAGLEK